MAHAAMGLLRRAQDRQAEAQAEAEDYVSNRRNFHSGLLLNNGTRPHRKKLLLVALRRTFYQCSPTIAGEQQAAVGSHRRLAARGVVGQEGHHVATDGTQLVAVIDPAGAVHLAQAVERPAHLVPKRFGAAPDKLYGARIDASAELKIAGTQAGVLRYACEHPWPEFFIIVESKIRNWAILGAIACDASPLPLDRPAESNERSQHPARLGGPPTIHAAIKRSPGSKGTGSPCSMRSAITCRASAVVSTRAAASVAP